MTSKTIPDIIQQIAQTLKQQSESIFNHPGNIGDSREKELIQFLKKVMPDCYGFSSGEIIDINNNRSHQTDIIIYDKLFSPYFTDGSGKIVAPVDSVFGIIEVKSVLNDIALEQVKNQITTIEGMDREKPKGIQVMPYLPIIGGTAISVPCSNNDMIFSLFAYDSDLKFGTIAQKIIEKKINVHLIIVKDKFIIIANNYGNLSKSPQSASNMLILEGGNVISIFILLLQLYLSQCRLVGTEINKLTNDLIKSFNAYSVRPKEEITITP